MGDYTYYDDPDDPLAFERDAFLYAYGPERLVIGRYCAIASGVRFVMPGANHADLGPSTFPFGIFGEPWASETMDLVMGAASRGERGGVRRPALRDRRRQPGARDPLAFPRGGRRAPPPGRLRTIMAGEPADLERIATEHGLRA